MTRLAPILKQSAALTVNGGQLSIQNLCKFVLAAYAAASVCDWALSRRMLQLAEATLNASGLEKNKMLIKPWLSYLNRCPELTQSAEGFEEFFCRSIDKYFPEILSVDKLKIFGDNNSLYDVALKPLFEARKFSLINLGCCE